MKRKTNNMEKEEIEQYLKKLEEIEKTLNEDDGESHDMNYLSELEEVLNKLSGEITNGEVSKNINTPFDGQNIINTQPTMTGGGTLVKVKKLVPEAVIPSYSKVGDAGMDLTITKEIENTSFSVSYGFGIALEIPQGYVGLVFPRSSVRNQDLILSNCVGVIDSGYRGELQATFKKTQGLDSVKYKVGERGAQIIILPYPTIYMTEVPELSNTERGSGGFGSTGV
jgi:dUTP pyrophosphatase